METIVLIVIVIFAVLQVILFFKLWGATNDIAKIKNCLVGNSNPLRSSLFNEVDEELAIGHTEKAKEILKRAKYELSVILNKSNYEKTEKLKTLASINKKLNEIDPTRRKNNEEFFIGDFVTLKKEPNTLMFIDSVNEQGGFDCMTSEGEFIGTFMKDQLCKAE